MQYSRKGSAFDLNGISRFIFHIILSLIFYLHFLLLWSQLSIIILSSFYQVRTIYFVSTKALSGIKLLHLRPITHNRFVSKGLSI